MAVTRRFMANRGQEEPSRGGQPAPRNPAALRTRPAGHDKLLKGVQGVPDLSLRPGRQQQQVPEDGHFLQAVPRRHKLRTGRRVNMQSRGRAAAACSGQRLTAALRHVGIIAARILSRGI